MISLKELTAIQEITGMSDIEIIREFFIRNEMEEEAIKIITDLSAAKINKLNNHINIFQTWASCLPSEYLYENYDLKTATKLHALELNYLAYDRKLGEQTLEWARENVPNIEMPEIYFQPLIKWLDKQGIKFKQRNWWN